MLARRMLTIPAVFLAWAVWLCATPLWLVLAIGVDLFRRNGQVALRCALLIACYLTCEVVGVSICALLWLWRRAVRVDDAEWTRIHFALEACWGASIFDAIIRLFDVTLEVTDRAELARGPYLLFPRHTSIVEALLAAALVSRPHGLRLRYVLKKSLIWGPCLDIVGHRVPNVFVDRFSDEPSAEIARIQGLAENLGRMDGVLIYPEGTRFTTEKQKRIIEHLRSEGDAERLAYATSLRRTLPPRMGGAVGLLEAARGIDVVFCANTGFEATASPKRMWAGELLRQTVRVDFRRVPRSEIPTTRDGREDWLRREWKRIDEWVEIHERGDIRDRATV